MKFMAIDQYENVYHNLVNPRKELMEKIGCQHCQKMYIDTNNGPFHVGYVIKGHWCRLYQVIPLMNKA